jgi:hypothetical protein
MNKKNIKQDKVKSVCSRLFFMLTFAVLSFPALSFGATIDFTGVRGLFEIIVDGGMALMVAICVVFFLYKISQFMLHINEEDKRKDLKIYLLYGIIALAVATTLGGLIVLLQDAVGIR